MFFSLHSSGMPKLALTALHPMQEDRKKKSSVPAAPSPCSLAPTRTPAIPAEVQRPASWSSVTAAISKRRLSDTKAVVLVPQWRRSAELHSSACTSSCHHWLPSGRHGEDAAPSPHQGTEEEKTHCCSGQSITSGTGNSSSITTEGRRCLWLHTGAFYKLQKWESPAEALNQPASRYRQRKQYLEPCPSVQAGKASVSDKISSI